MFSGNVIRKSKSLCYCAQINSFFLLCVYFLFYSITIGVYKLRAENDSERTFEVMPWKVGQFVEYQVISMEEEGRNNRYKISLVGKENVEGKLYFWMQVDIYEFLLYRYQKKPELKKNITFLMLVPLVTTEDFSKSPIYYITNGFFPQNAIRLKVKIYDGPFIEIVPKTYFSYQNIIEDTAYSITPDAMGKIDFSRMKVSNTIERITAPAGNFECEHIFVNTDVDREYWDEGFDLWRSPAVPLLGIVKMEFSKTLYWEKWSYKNESKKIKTINDFFLNLYTKRVPGRRRPDTHIISLVGYGENKKNQN